MINHATLVSAIGELDPLKTLRMDIDVIAPFWQKPAATEYILFQRYGQPFQSASVQTQGIVHDLSQQPCGVTAESDGKAVSFSVLGGTV